MEIRSFEIEKLAVHVYDTRESMGAAAADDAAARINGVIQKKGEATVVFAAAPSQNELLSELKKRDIDFSRVRAMHQDEYVGLDREHPAGFGNFLRRAMFCDAPFMEVIYLCPEGLDPEAACLRYDALLREYPPDVILLGVGENGHLAFNDPAVADFDDPKRVKIVALDDVCRMQQVNDGCFAAISEVPKTAITLTMSLIKSIPERITVVPGPKKAAAVYRLINGDISESCPASMLRALDGSALYLDKDSAAKL